jgi:PAS domain S-box-containing protein
VDESKRLPILARHPVMRGRYRRGAFRTRPAPELRCRPTGLVQVIDQPPNAEQAAGALQESEARYRALFDSNPLPTWVYGVADLRFLAVNDAAVATYGYTRAEFLDMTFDDLRLPQEVQRLHPPLAEGPPALDDTGTWRYRTKDGQILDVKATSRDATFAGRAARIVVAHDVTERNRAEQALLEATQRLAIAAQASSGLWDWTLNTNDVRYSGEWKRHLGYSDEEIEDRLEEWQSRLHPEDLPRIMAHLKAYLENPVQYYESEARLRHKDGSYRWIYSRGQLLRDANGRAVRMLGCHIDTTERKRSEESLREREEHYRGMVELSPDAVSIHQDYRWVFANSAAAAILGVAGPHELIGRPILDFIQPKDRPLLQARMQRLYVERAPLPPIEIEMIRADGTTVYLETKVVPVTWQGRPAAEAVAHDITERKRAEQALIEYADRLQGLSRRLMEVEETERRKLHEELHDRIGQNLSALGLALDLVRTHLPDPSAQPVLQRLDEVQALLKTTTAQVRNLMAELHPPALHEYGLLAALRSYVDTFRRTTALRVSIRGKETSRLSRAAELALFRIAQEALINCAKHARAKRVEISLRATAGEMVLRVEDDGEGFDPGQPGSRASWGLTIMRDRADAVGARLKIDAAPGRGTRLTVAVPGEPE